MQKILNIISVLSFVLVAAITGGGVFGYLWITNEDNQKMLQDKAMEKVMGAMKMLSFLRSFAVQDLTLQ